MEYINLDKVLKDMYDYQVSYIRKQSIELEREYFSENNIPMKELMNGLSYEEHFMTLKYGIKDCDEFDINQIFIFLQEYLLFSNGHDMMFKKKLEADCFESVPMDDFIYPKLAEAVREKYNDVSVMEENPNFEANIEDIHRIIFIYTEMQSLLYFLYCCDFNFPNEWEKLYPENHEEIINILNKSGITIGDFLHALIDFKCNIMNEIFGEISNPQLRKTYQSKVEELRKEKHEETKDFTHVSLPITYFLDHTLADFMNIKRKSPILEDTTPNGSKKILLPRS